MGPPPAPPVLDPPAAATGASALTLTGTAPGADQVEVSGPTGLAVAPVVADAFALAVSLAPNQLNVLHAVASSALAGKSAATTAMVIQDGQPPKVFIDYPPDGLVIETGTAAGLAVDVAGRVSDVLSGFAGLTVEVNGVAAAVDVGIGTNGTFFAPGVPLAAESATVLLAVARDALANEATASVSVQHVLATGPLMSAQGGNAQSGPVSQELPLPLVVQVLKGDGSPFAGKLVTFTVSKSDGALAAVPGASGKLSLQVATDGAGLARAYWRLGSDAGCGNNRVGVTSKDIAGTLLFCASATAAPATQIAIGGGDGQSGEVESALPLPLSVWVSDGNNPAAGVPVTFTAVQGLGTVDGAVTTVATTDATGHAQVA